MYLGSNPNRKNTSFNHGSILVVCLFFRPSQRWAQRWNDRLFLSFPCVGISHLVQHYYKGLTKAAQFHRLGSQR